MAENPSGTESLLLQIQQVEHERDELRKDIEQLCMQQAGPGYLVVATKMHFQRTAALEQEIESLKKKLATCTRENMNLQEELSEAYRIKGQLADLHQAEVTKNQEAEKQLKFFQGCVAAAFAERDHSIMEAEKAKEKEETMDTKLSDVQNRMEELRSQCLEQRILIDRLQSDLAKQEKDNVAFKKVVDMFYEIRQQSFECSEDRTWDQKCSCLLNDPPEIWSYNDPSTSKYISAVEEELQSVRNTVDVLQNKLRVGLEIENHLKKKVRDLEKKKLVSDKMLRNGISGLRQHHSLHRLQIMDVLEEERCYINSLIGMLNLKIKQITETREMDAQSSLSTVEEPDRNDSSDEQESNIGTKTNLKPVSERIYDGSKGSVAGDASEALAQALREKVSVLLLLSQQEERHLLERNVNAALQKKIEELQRNLLQVTNEKVKALMEMAKLRQDYQLLQEKMDPETRQGKDIVPVRGNRSDIQDQDGKLRNILKKTYLKRWIGNTIDFGRNAVESRFSNEGNISGRKSNNGMEFARVKIENATLKESLESMEHLTSSIHRLRISLMQAKESVGMGDESVKEIIAEAMMVKTALSSCLPVSWSAEEEMMMESESSSSHTIVSGEEEEGNPKVDFVSAAGFEMVELLILAAQLLKEKYIH